MKVHYDKEVDALYLSLGDQKPDGVIEITEGISAEILALALRQREPVREKYELLPFSSFADNIHNFLSRNFRFNRWYI